MATPSHTLPFLVRPQVQQEQIGIQPLRTLLIADGIQTLDSGLLHSFGYRLYPAGSAEEARREFPLARPELIVIDCREGKPIIRMLREWTNAPIVVISERTEESEKIDCLDTGADDYVTKPFHMGELLARFRAALRRAFGIPRSQIFVAGDLQVNFTRRTVAIRNQLVDLTGTEYELLKILASHAGAVRTYGQLIHALWGSTEFRDAMHLLRVTMSNLRRKLTPERDAAWLIATEPRVGDRLGKETEWAQPREA